MADCYPRLLTYYLTSSKSLGKLDLQNIVVNGKNAGVMEKMQVTTFCACPSIFAIFGNKFNPFGVMFSVWISLKFCPLVE